MYEILPLTCCLKSVPHVTHLNNSGVRDIRIVSALQVGQVPLTSSARTFKPLYISYNSFYQGQLV
jgi:hypothetical protein